jgi:hypothetical protein
VLLAAFAASLVLGAVNNAVNPRGVPWIGSPEVLVQNPWDAIVEPHQKGIAQAFRFAWKEARAQAVAIAAGLALVVAVSLVLRKIQRARWSELAETWFRLAMAAMLLGACWGKLSAPTEFADAVAQYRFLPPPLVNPFAIWMPAFELVVALGLVLTSHAREFYWLLTLLWLMFLAALGQALSRRLGITCGCFALREAYSSVGETWFSLLRDLLLLPPTLWLALRAQERQLWHFGRIRSGSIEVR